MALALSRSGRCFGTIPTTIPTHPLWVSYAEQFDLDFLDVTDDRDCELPIVINGNRLSGEAAKTLGEHLESSLEELNTLAATVLEDAASWQNRV